MSEESRFDKRIRSKKLRKKSKNDIIKYKKNKGEKMSKEVKKTTNEGKEYSFASTSYVKKPDHPRLENIDSGAILPQLSSFLYNIVEIPKGVTFCASFFKGEEDFEINFKDGEDPSNQSAYLTLEANINAEGLPLYKPFRDLARILGYRRVNFTVFVEYIDVDTQMCNYFTKEDVPARVIVTDIYINDNWVRHKDLIKLCTSCGLETMPVLYEGAYNQKVIDTYANEVCSLFNEKEKMYGVVVKLAIEDEKNSKRIAKVRLNDRFVKALPSPSPPTIDNNMIKKIGDYVDTNFNDINKIVIDKIIENKYPGFKNSESYDVTGILTFAVDSAKSIYCLSADQFKVKESDKKKVDKEINKKLSAIFIGRYNMLEKGVKLEN